MFKRARLDVLLAAALGLSGALLGGSAQPARAQSESDADGEESPELRALRLAEMELFGPSEPLVVIEPGSAPLPATSGTVPDALSSDAPPPVVRSGSSGDDRDLSWLSGLSLPDMPIRWDDRVVRYLEFFRDDPRGHELIRGWMVRRERWGELIRSTLRSEGLPEDLLYVAMVESGFTADARSDAGAVGPWQFVSGTGAEYGLTQSHWIDLRRDPEAATRAAARYLRALHERFGTWELALAAYNMGYGALLRAMRKYDTNDYWELTHLESALPFETTLYVAKIMACAIVGRNLPLFGFAELTMEAPMVADDVEVPGGTALSVIARVAGTTVAELRRLNPALRRDRVPPGADAVAVRIPEGAGERFAERWERARPRSEAHVAYAVRFGERLDDVARRFRTTARSLREVNELPEDDDVDAGFTLMVPAVEPHDERPSEPPVVAVHETFTYPSRRRVFYPCHRGDDVQEIARFFRVSADDVVRWNHLDPHAALQDGIVLQLFVPTSVDLSRAVVMTPDEVQILVVGSDAFFAHHLASEGRVRFRYEVQPGDTLSTIGARFGISVGSLCRINLIGRDAVLRLGQQIVIYAEPSRVPAELRASIEPPPEPAAVETPAAETTPAEAAETPAAETTAAGTTAETPAAEAAEPSDAADGEAPALEASDASDERDPADGATPTP